jgi:NADH dehydrogenase
MTVWGLAMEAEKNAGGQRPRVVIIGAGFGGLQAATHLARKPVDVLLLDRNNYHGFWPLLYQVATAQLDPQQIAYPARAIIRGMPNIEFRVAEVQSIDRSQRVVNTDQGTFSYDELIVSPGSTTNFFGLEQLQTQSFELKDLPDAMSLRNHLVACFEHAVGETDPDRVQRLLTFVIVGGGPTGVEMAGAVEELVRHTMKRDYPMLDFSKAKVVLVEMLDRVLPPFPPSLSQSAQQALTNMGVELRLGASVTGYENGILKFKDGTTLPTETVLWAAGVQASSLGKTLGVQLQRGGRVPVTPALHLPDDPNVWVIGDLAYLEGPDGKPYPMLATVAMQQGRLVARNIIHKLKGEPLERYRYFDKGIMATIGRRAAVASFWRLKVHGTLAWLLWLAVHLFYLIGFRNRAAVLFNWAYSYITFDREARAIVAAARPPKGEWLEYEPVAAATQQVGG